MSPGTDKREPHIPTGSVYFRRWAIDPAVRLGLKTGDVLLPGG
jgi:hypothetical protein